MRTFAELLTEYMKRVGISDSELARALGVRRQTIFRWKEGLVEKPRYREDVLRCATKLRLTPEERDELLLAAGFPPERPITVAPETLPAKVEPTPAVEVVEAPVPRALEPVPERLPVRARPRWVWAGIAILVLVAIGGALSFALSSQSVTFPTAAQGETLVIIAPFRSQVKPSTAPTPVRQLPESASQAVFDVSSRLQDALEREVRAARLERVRLAIFPEPITDAAGAERIRLRANAAVVIWGTSSDETVVAALTVAPRSSRADDMPLDALVAEPSEAQIRIIGASAEQVQVLALVVLSQLHLERGDFGMARAALTQALSRTPRDQSTLATLNLWMGYVAQIAKPPELGVAIQFYSQTIDLAPETPTAYLNRGVAYVRLNDPQWQSDYARVLAFKPDHIGVRQGLCWAHALDQKPELALPHCDAAVSRDATARSREARSIVYAQLGRLSEAANDLQAFLDWLARQPESLRARYGTMRANWIQALRVGQNPIDQTVLGKLRQE